MDRISIVNRLPVVFGCLRRLGLVLAPFEPHFGTFLDDLGIISVRFSTNFSNKCLIYLSLAAISSAATGIFPFVPVLPFVPVFPSCHEPAKKLPRTCPQNS